MLSIAIVDDDPNERKMILDCLAFVQQQRNERYAVQVFESARAFLFRFEQQFDIVLMDISFQDGLDGMSAARTMREIDRTVILIFVTNLAQMAIQGYEVDALDFIVKPLDHYAFLLKMTRALGRVIPRSSNSIMVHATDGDVRLQTKLITWLEINDHYVVYHSSEGTFTEYLSLSAAMKKLDDPMFFRCDRSVAVNLRFVTRLNRETCVVDGQEITVARSLRSSFKQAYAAFLDGKLTRRGE